ncbi:hypothetical protein [Aristaeella lactis]|uniref:Uncharacterized protein n=1 Tax=Aristaeella lactis TaxID=3046383 RepID=A0AC61PPF3_9FIRM|nr:hypothetical protein [Aristaeella lactis]QUA53239.1 hypothetical protein JYE50_01025 [Aristaeella lactis]SMC81318.1 hypothetical protein SAMN06297397_2668 [Aristaeella lactis]
MKLQKVLENLVTIVLPFIGFTLVVVSLFASKVFGWIGLILMGIANGYNLVRRLRDSKKKEQEAKETH